VFWEAVTLWTFTVPVDAPALPTRQPVVPWIVVITTTVVQVVVLYRKLSGKPVPPWLWVTAAVLSLYDFGTTYAGLGTVVWLRQVGIIARGVLAFLLTFVVETAAGFALKRR